MSYREFSETAAILDAILNFSKRSRMHRVHPADSERVDLGLPKSIKKKTLHEISEFSNTSARLGGGRCWLAMLNYFQFISV